VEPIIGTSTSVGLAWLVLYSAPEGYGSSYLVSHYTSAYVNAAVTVTNDATIAASARDTTGTSYFPTPVATYGTINDVYNYSITAPTTGLSAISTTNAILCGTLKGKGMVAALAYVNTILGTDPAIQAFASKTVPTTVLATAGTTGTINVESDSTSHVR